MESFHIYQSTITWMLILIWLIWRIWVMLLLTPLLSRYLSIITKCTVDIMQLIFSSSKMLKTIQFCTLSFITWHLHSQSNNWVLHWRRGWEDQGVPSPRLSLWPNASVSMKRRMANKSQQLPKRPFIPFQQTGRMLTSTEMKWGQRPNEFLDLCLNQHDPLP